MSSSILKLAALALLAPTALGCAAPTGDGASSSKQAASVSGSNTPVPTTKTDLTFFRGYNTLFDEGLTSCITPQPASGATYSVGEMLAGFTMSEVSSDVTLAKELDLDLGLGIKLPLVNASADLSLVNSFSSTNTTVSILINAHQGYTVTNLQPFNLTAQALSLLTTTSADGFLQHCGDSFVNGLQFQAQLAVLIQYVAEDETTAQTIAADLTGGGGAIVAGSGATVDANLKAKLINDTTLKGVTATVTVAVSGFAPGTSTSSGLIALGAGITNDTFTQIESLLGAMNQSVVNDFCQDGGRGSCSGTASSGYPNNTSRMAVPAFVLAGGYYNAMNAPPFTADTSPYNYFTQKLQQTDAYIRAYSQLGLQVSHAYKNEIAPFLAAGSDAQALYNVAPQPGTGVAPGVMHVSEMVGASQYYAAQFHTDDGVAPGAVTQQIEQAEQACWNNAITVGDYSACQLGTDPTTLGPYQQAQTALQDYSLTGRILPLRFGILPPATYSDLNAACASSGGAFTQAPGPNDVTFLATAIGAPSNASNSYSAWYNDPQACSGGGNPYLANTPGSSDYASDHYQCDTSGGGAWGSTGQVLPTYCVGTDGPFGTLPTL